MRKNIQLTKSPELNEMWEELQDIFLQYRKLTAKMISRLERLGFEIRCSKNHAIMYKYVNGVKKTVTIASTPSDLNAGCVALRQIRKIYEEETKGEIK